MIQRLCAMFLVHYGVNLWTLNNQLMSAYDVAAASNYVSLTRLLDAAASRAFVDDWHGVKKLCRRAAKSARRRFRVQTRSTGSVDVYVDGRLQTTSGSVDNCSGSTVRDGTSVPGSSVFVQSPRLVNGRLFPPSTDTQGHATSTRGSCRRRRFWPISTQRTRRRVDGGSDELSGVAAAARQLLLMSVDDDSLYLEAKSRVAREQLRLSTAADSSCATTGDDNGFTPSGVDSQFYCRDDTSAGRLSEVVNDRARTGLELPQSVSSSLSCAPSTHNPAGHVNGTTVTDRTSASSELYSVPADCIERRHAVYQPRHGSRSARRLSSSKSARLRQTSVDDGRLRQWLVNNGLSDYWSLLATEKVDLDTLTLLRDEDLRQLGVPLGPRRRLQRAVSQLQRPALSAADITFV